MMEGDIRTTTTVEILQSTADSSDEDVMNRLVPVVYDELCELAHRQLSRERGRHTLRTTALVHEAYLRLVGHTDVTSRGRSYFFGAAARAMRQVLVDHARKRKAKKRGSGLPALRLEEEVVGVDAFAHNLLDLDDALNRLAADSPRQARVVECRFFGGLSIDETAAALDVSERTVRYDWALARARLVQALDVNEMT